VAETDWVVKQSLAPERGCVADQPQQHSPINTHDNFNPHRSARVLRLIPLRGTQSRSFTFRKLAAPVSFRLNSRMRQPPRSRKPGPPHNPGLRDLVQGKHQWSSPPKIENLKQGFRHWHERGYLPHRDEPGLTQFVTYRLADSFPESLRSEWEYLWMIESDEQRRIEIEAYLDRGHGVCHLRQSAIAEIVEEAMQIFHGQRYDLKAWVVMPNHVHVLFKVEAVPMAEILESWKKHTAQKANRLLGRRGPFWAEDYFDTFVRDAEHEQKTIHYIENNPTKAKFVLDPKEWLWSSARFRDQLGCLKLPA
jgi:REP element-mobilizing transposase RayT